MTTAPVELAPETIERMISLHLLRIVNMLRDTPTENRDPAQIARLITGFYGGVDGKAIPVTLVERIGRDAGLLPREAKS